MMMSIPDDLLLLCFIKKAQGAAHHVLVLSVVG
jgi:predicted transglutaminase-like cysteine proteinase